MTVTWDALFAAQYPRLCLFVAGVPQFHYTREAPEYFAQAGFVRAWIARPNSPDSINQGYLRYAAKMAIVDYIRALGGKTYVRLVDWSCDPISGADDALDTEAVLQLLRPDERRYWSLAAPRDVAVELGLTALQVYRGRLNAIRRMRRQPEIKEMLCQ